MKRMILGVLVSTLGLGVPGRAAEEGDFPGAHSELKGQFGRYFEASKRGLSALDGMTDSDRAVSSQWVSICRAVKAELNRSKVQAGSVPEPVTNWWRQELAAWDNVASIGGDLISLHDEILAQTKKLESEILPAHRSKVGKIQVMAKAADQAVGVFIEGSLDTARGIVNESVLARAIEDSGRVLSGLNSLNQEVADLRTRLESSGYRTRLAALAAKDIDPDQSGVFVRHEKKWESALSSTLHRYDEAYKTYVGEVQQVQSYEILRAYQYLRDLPRVPGDAASWLRERWNRSKVAQEKEEARTLSSLSLTSNRVPAKMRSGESALFELILNNRGSVPLKAGYKVTCEVEAPPKDAERKDSLNFTYQHEDGPQISAGRAARLTRTIHAPASVGTWRLLWKVWVDGKVVEDQRARIEVQARPGGESAAHGDGPDALRGVPSLSLRANRVPSRMNAGEEALLEVLLDNRGKGALKKGWTVDCEVESAPQGADSRSKENFRYTHSGGPQVLAGRAVRLSQRVQAPLEVGNWNLVWKVRVDGKVVEEHKQRIEIVGTQSARMGRVDAPKTIKLGRGGRVSVPVENSGNVPIDSADLSVEVEVTRSPSGYRHSNRDFALKLRPDSVLRPGDGETLRGQLTAPTDPKAVGDWKLEVHLRLDRRVVARQKIDVRVEP